MVSAQTIINIVALLLPILIGVIGWLVACVYKMNREQGVMSNKLDNIVSRAKEEADSTDRRFDKKKNKE